MSALRTLASLSSRRLQSTALPVARRQASTLPHPFQPRHYSLKERFTKFVPVESYPLIAFVIAMSSFGLGKAYHAFIAVPGELRLMPARLEAAEAVEPWETERARAGKW
ncbi:hypothetical protein JCM10207_005006 [Rhodosporidiobolus poonsookiae]